MSETQKTALTLQEKVDKYLQVHATAEGLKETLEDLKSDIKDALQTDEEIEGTSGKKKVVKTESRSVKKTDKNLIKMLESEGLLDTVSKTEIDTKKLQAVMEINPKIQGAASYTTKQVLTVRKA